VASGISRAATSTPGSNRTLPKMAPLDPASKVTPRTPKLPLRYCKLREKTTNYCIFRAKTHNKTYAFYCGFSIFYKFTKNPILTRSSPFLHWTFEHHPKTLFPQPPAIYIVPIFL
jgi:hypothetical protein